MTRYFYADGPTADPYAPTGQTGQPDDQTPQAPAKPIDAKEAERALNYLAGMFGLPYPVDYGALNGKVRELKAGGSSDLGGGPLANSLGRRRTR